MDKIVKHIIGGYTLFEQHKCRENDKNDGAEDVYVVRHGITYAGLLDLDELPHVCSFYK